MLDELVLDSSWVATALEELLLESVLGVVGLLEELMLDSSWVATASEELLLDSVLGVVGLLEELKLDLPWVATASEELLLNLVLGVVGLLQGWSGLAILVAAASLAFHLMPNLMPGLSGLLGVSLALPEVPSLSMLLRGATAASGELVLLGERFGSLVGVVAAMSRAVVAQIARCSTDVPNCPDGFQFPQVHQLAQGQLRVLSCASASWSSLCLL